MTGNMSSEATVQRGNVSSEDTEGNPRSSSVREAQRRVAPKCAGAKAFLGGRVFWFGLPKPPLEHAVSVNHFFIWRQHLVWSKRNGEELRNILTQRYASSTVILSLLLSTELGVLFSPSPPANSVRIALGEEQDRSTLEFWTGVILCVSVFLTIAGLISTFTAWSVFASLSRENVHCIIRSTLGLYAAQMPSNIIMLAIYFFFTWIILFWYILMPLSWAIALNTVGVILIGHVVSTYSALGRVIMHSGAMGEEPILSRREQEMKTPEELFKALKRKTKLARKANIPVYRQYRIPYQQSLRDLSRGVGQSEVLRLARHHQADEAQSKAPNPDHSDAPGDDAPGMESNEPPALEPSDTVGISMEEDP